MISLKSKLGRSSKAYVVRGLLFLEIQREPGNNSGMESSHDSGVDGPRNRPHHSNNSGVEEAEEAEGVLQWYWK